MTRFLLPLIFILLGVTVAHSQETSIVDLDIHENGKKYGEGQGTVYRQHDGRTYILTAWHCCHSYWDQTGAKPLKVVARYGEDEQVCEILAWDRIHDLAVLSCPSLDAADAIGVANGFEIGQQLRFYGREETRTGTAHECSLSGFIWSDCVSIRGDSGGPICNEDGELVGVISGGAIAYDAGMRLSNSGKSVWPTRAGASPAIADLFDDHPEISPMPGATVQDRKHHWPQPEYAKPKPLTLEGIKHTSKALNRPTLILVSASWCGPCQKLKKNTVMPMKLGGELDGTTVLILDYDKDRKSCKNLMTGTSVPQLIYVYKDGDQWKHKTTKGYKTQAQLKAFLNTKQGR